MCFQPLLSISRIFRYFSADPFQGKSSLKSLCSRGSEHTLHPFVLHLTDLCACKTRHPVFRRVPFSYLSQRFWGCDQLIHAVSIWNSPWRYKNTSAVISALAAQMNLILHPAMARTEMPFSEEAGELGKTHSCASRGTWDEQIPGWQNKEHRSRKLHILPVIFWWLNLGPSWTGLSQPCTAVWAACHTSRLVICSQHWPLIRLSCHFPGPVLQQMTRNISFTTWKRLLTYIELVLYIC